MSAATAAKVAEVSAAADAAAVVTGTKAEAKTTETSFVPWWSTHDAMTISASVLVFGALLILFAARVVQQGIAPGVVLRLFGMLTIIIMAVFLVVAGYDAQQISPVVGLLATLAGYLAGRSTTAAETAASSRKADPN